MDFTIGRRDTNCLTDGCENVLPRIPSQAPLAGDFDASFC